MPTYASSQTNLLFPYGIKQICSFPMVLHKRRWIRGNRWYFGVVITPHAP